MSFLRMLLNINSADGVRESMKDSYSKHVRAAQNGTIPLAEGVTYHIAGLYGALSTRYMSAKIPRLEPLIWSELVPFILMPEQESPEALAEYVVCAENWKGQYKKEWLQKLINSALRKIATADPNYRALVSATMLQPNEIYWINLLDSDVKSLLQDELV